MPHSSVDQTQHEPPQKKSLFSFSAAPLFSHTSSLANPSDMHATSTLEAHLRLLGGDFTTEIADDISSAPLFATTVLEHAQKSSEGLKLETFTQFGLLGGAIKDGPASSFSLRDLSSQQDPRIFQNVATPMSAFICGSQGSGKSHTLSCMLENCLVNSTAGVLPRPLTGIVFHYDNFVSDTGGSPCEAAFLSSNAGIKVRVLCPPTNITQMKVRIHASQIALLMLSNSLHSASTASFPMSLLKSCASIRLI